MAAITAGDFRNGVTFEYEGKVMQVVEFQHVKPGKGAAFVRTKMKNVITGSVTETSFNPTAKFETAHVDKREMQYLYNDGSDFNFMDNNTYEQEAISADIVGDEEDMGFNSRFLLDALRNSESDEVRVELKGAHKPMKVMPKEGDSFLFLVLPVRLRNEK